MGKRPRLIRSKASVRKVSSRIRARNADTFSHRVLQRKRSPNTVTNRHREKISVRNRAVSSSDHRAGGEKRTVFMPVHLPFPPGW